VARPACLRPTINQELPSNSTCNCLISTDLIELNDDIETQCANSTIFIYENEQPKSQQPSNLLPFAVLKFQIEDPNIHNRLIYTKTTNLVTPPLNDSFSFNDSETTSTTTDIISLATFQTTTDTSAVLAKSADFKQTQFELISKTQKPTPIKKKFSFSKKHPSPGDLHSPACQLNSYFQASPTIKSDQVSSFDETISSLETIDKITYEKLPRWRYSYERTGQRKLVFPGRFRWIIRLSNIYTANPGLKFSDLDQTSVNLKLPENKFLIPKQNTNKQTDSKKVVVTSKPSSTTKSLPVKNLKESSTKPSSLSLSSSKTTPKQPDKPLKKSNLLTQGVVKSSKLIQNNQKTKETSISIGSNSAKSTPKSENNLNKSVTINKLKSSTPVLKDDLIDSSGLSSEMTALEKRLLGLDKMKALKAKSSVSETNKSSSKLSLNLEKVSQKVKLEPEASGHLKVGISPLVVKDVKPTPASIEMPKKPKDIQEELRKINAKLKAEKKLEESVRRPASETVKSMLKEEKEAVKRKKSFWDPDSDTEYDLVKKLSRADDDSKSGGKVKSSIINVDNGRFCILKVILVEFKILKNIKKFYFFSIIIKVKEVEEDEYDNETEYVIVSKQHLNIQPVQYSKSFYDLNMNGLEHELKRFSPSDNSLSPQTHTITKHIKTPIEPDLKAAQLKTSKPEPQQNKMRINRTLAQQPKFMHHYITNTQKTLLKQPQSYTQVAMSQFDVDSLKNLKAKSKSYVNLCKQELLYGDKAIVEIVCHEIHAGGFRCIEEHQFQKSANYLRRTQSFQAGEKIMSPGKDEQGNLLKKISLTDYVSTRGGGGGAKSSGTSTPAQMTSYPNSINSVKTPNSCDPGMNFVNEAEDGFMMKIGN